VKSFVIANQDVAVTLYRILHTPPITLEEGARGEGPAVFIACVGAEARVCDLSEVDTR